MAEDIIENEETPEVPEVYTLVVTTSPAGASATIEGHTPEVNGAKKTFTFSEQDIVTVKVSLEGYVSQTKEIEMDSSKTTTITLKAEANTTEEKSYVAVWQIRRDGEYLVAGDSVDDEKFEDDIKRLLEIGAIREV